MSRLIKLRLGLAAIIPYELAKKLGLEEGQEVIVKESKFGLFINPLKGSEKKEALVFSKEEIEIMNKLLAMKFADRTPKNVSNGLNPSERKVLDELLERKAVNLFKSQKYKEGVYNIRDNTYDIIKKQGQGKEMPVQQTKEMKASASEKSMEKTKEIEDLKEIEADPLKVLERQGYVVIDDQNTARRISEDIASRGKKRDIIGIRGFDRKYYVLKTSFFVRNQPKIKAALKGGKKNLEEISKESGLDKQACTGILAIMNDNSDVIEKRKGVFVLAE